MAEKVGAEESYGLLWPTPTPINLEQGDAVITLHSVPHSATLNFNPSGEERMNVYFRLRRMRPGGLQVFGDSDHPDLAFKAHRKALSELYAADAPDPFRIAIDKLCDHWSEWDGMQEVVARERARKEQQRKRA